MSTKKSATPVDSAPSEMDTPVDAAISPEPARPLEEQARALGVDAMMATALRRRHRWARGVLLTQSQLSAALDAWWNGPMSGRTA
jgi:hypothetical protein